MTAIQKFKSFLSEIDFNIVDYIFLTKIDNLSGFQKKVLKEATKIIEGNTIGEIKYFGGDLKKNQEDYDEFLETGKKELEKSEYDENRKELKGLFKNYAKILKDLIDKTCYAIIPVKEMPWSEIIFRTVPKIKFNGEKVELIDDIIAYYGVINCPISKTTIYGRIKDEDPLFAPVMGEFDLQGFKFKESSEGSKKSYNYSYIDAILDSLESSSTKNHLARYHEGFQRHGEPICDFLMERDDLMKVMNNLQSSIDSGRNDSEIAVCGIALPQPADKNSLVLVIDEGGDSDTFNRCFEAVLRFSAVCCDAPSTPSPSSTGAPQGGLSTSQQQGGKVTTPGGQELKSWTAEELAQEAAKRSSSSGLPNGIEVWSSDDLEKFSKERKAGLPEGMEVWKEEELEELAKKRQGGGLDIPQWEPDDKIKECSKCGYALREGWSECPICGTSVGKETNSGESSIEQIPQELIEDETEKTETEVMDSNGQDIENENLEDSDDNISDE
ncbi:MAG: hypothetical protein GF317_14060 [Candidatus Lokiarchaeota archaeon]|nr:hypothetical protein [Candidatus Lokiarchaeota archaeon]MBD3200741.1 hypothetical protein [Candidatus Lokiarchaeota archaeon]